MSLDSWFYNNDDEDFGYHELVETKGKGAVSNDASSLERSFKVAWNNVPRFLDDLLGYACKSISAFTGLSRVLPDQHCIYPNFWAMEATVEGIGQPSYTFYDRATGEPYITNSSSSSATCQDCCDTLSYPFAKITATYKPVDYAILPDTSVTSETERYCTFTYGYSSEFMTLQQGMFFETTGQVMQGGAGKVQFVTTLNLVWHIVPASTGSPFVPPTEAAVTALAGKINAAPFLGYEAGTVLFLGAEPKLRLPKLSANLCPDTTLYWDVGYSFAIKNNSPTSDFEAGGWNYFYEISLGVYDPVWSKKGGTGNQIYETGDFTQLFTLP